MGSQVDRALRKGLFVYLISDIFIWQAFKPKKSQQPIQPTYNLTYLKVVDVLNGAYSNQIEEYIIVDSRYPYEYLGGHIQSALNIYTKEDLYEAMLIQRLHLNNKMPSSMSSNCLLQPTTLKTNKNIINSSSSLHSVSTANMNSLKSEPTQRKRTIIIFHCEFSSERGPSLLRFLRNQDRSLNEQSYPNLFYPELYLLEGGYKSFYEKFKVDFVFLFGCCSFWLIDFFKRISASHRHTNQCTTRSTRRTWSTFAPRPSPGRPRVTTTWSATTTRTFSREETRCPPYPSPIRTNINQTKSENFFFLEEFIFFLTNI